MTVGDASDGSPGASLSDALEPHRRHIWGICYRMTGSAADADDLVQDAFTRALQRPPADLERSLRPWLVRVATNLATDHLRARKRRGYRGPWLPEPVELAADGLAPEAEPSPFASSTGARYELVESASFAFLVALEALTPKQRAVLLLRDVFDYSSRETGEVLAMSEGAVKTTLHRARATMERHDMTRRPHEGRDAEMLALGAFVQALVSQDLDAVEALLAEDVRALSDGGDEFLAAKVPVDGRARVARMYAKITAMAGEAVARDIVTKTLNGKTALLVRFENRKPREAPYVVTLVDLDDEGLITRIYTVLTTTKVGRLFAA